MIVARRIRTILLWGGLLIIDVAIQVAMKLAGDRLDATSFPSTDWLTALVTSPLAMLALAGYFATFVLWLMILHGASLSTAFPVTALTYGLVPCAAWLILGERISWGQTAGIAIIFSGIVLQGVPGD